MKKKKTITKKKFTAPKKKKISKSVAKKLPSKRVKNKFVVTAADLQRISNSLGVEAQNFGNHYRLYLENSAENRKLTLEIYPDIPIGTRRGALITVYTPNAHLQLQFCTGYVISEMLGEVTFVGMQNGKLSGLIIEKGAACSLYANVDTRLLSGDLTQLGPEVMLSSIALSLTETLIED